LENCLTIVLDDRKTLSEVCGVNDSNLRIIESLIDEKVFSRGNELFIESQDNIKREIFTSIINQLKDHTSMGHIPGPDLIYAIYNSHSKESSEESRLIKDLQIVVPQSGQRVFPRSYHQAMYMQKMDQMEIIISIGPAGTGKTYLAVAHALQEILSKTKRKLILTRPVVEAGERLGYLPGDLSQKISPYLRPLYDAMDHFIAPEMINKLEENRVIEIAPLAYMRGRSLQDSYIILDEAQNTTKEQMKMFLTRMGENSKIVVTGDITQIDLPDKKQSGLLHAIRILKHIPDIYFAFFDARDVVRNPLVKKIIQAYETHENE
jgi:phosphate starvation-inducible PhoH-like protein